MIVRSYMTPRPITLRMDSDAQSALRTMQEHAIHHLPVLDADERIAGIVAERDLLLAALRSPGASMDIADVVHRDVICIRDDMPVTHAATLMAKHTIGGLPVTDAKGRLVGVITETDLFRAFVEVMEAKMPRPEAGLGSAADVRSRLRPRSRLAVAASPRPPLLRRRPSRRKPMARLPAASDRGVRARAARPALRRATAG